MYTDGVYKYRGASGVPPQTPQQSPSPSEPSPQPDGATQPLETEVVPESKPEDPGVVFYPQKIVKPTVVQPEVIQAAPAVTIDPEPLPTNSLSPTGQPMAGNSNTPHQPINNQESEDALDVPPAFVLPSRHLFLHASILAVLVTLLILGIALIRVIQKLL